MSKLAGAILFIFLFEFFDLFLSDFLNFMKIFIIFVESEGKSVGIIHKIFKLFPEV